MMEDSSPASKGRYARALLEDAAILRRMIQTALDPVLCIDEYGIVVLWSDEAERTFGWTRDEAVGSDLARLIIPERFRSAHRQGLIRFLSGGPSAVLNRRVEVFALNRSGDEFPVELGIWPIETGQGHLFGAIVRDLRERKRQEAPLNELLAQREAILEASEVGIVMFDGREIRWVNRAFCDLLGRSKEEWIGLSGEPAFATHEAYLNFLTASRDPLRTNHFFSRETELYGVGGRPVWCLLKGRMVAADESDLRSIWVVEDISEQKQARQEIEKALAREQELGEMKSRFISMASHEFRTPLAAIQSCAQLIESYSDRMSATQRNGLIQSITAGVQRMTAMLDDVLLIGKAEAGRLEFRPEAIALMPFCGKLVDDIRMGIGARHRIILSADVDNPVAHLDAKLMTILLGNLLSNAVKYSPAESEVSLHIEDGADLIVFEVSDQGIGITPEDQSHLFETFFRGGNVGNVAGTGLGLAIVQRAADLHRGRVEVHSAPGRGTRMRVNIPKIRRPTS